MALHSALDVLGVQLVWIIYLVVIYGQLDRSQKACHVAVGYEGSLVCHVRAEGGLDVAEHCVNPGLEAMTRGERVVKT